MFEFNCDLLSQSAVRHKDISMKQESPGIEFEKVVTEIQARIEPNAVVLHNQRIIDRHGHSRQFDVEIRGKYAGQDILGVIECKDLSKKVGTPEVDAFVTKSQDINANFKIIVSRKGFTKPAIEKAKHYGIQTLSLIPQDEVTIGFKVGTYWFTDIYYWDKISLTLDFVVQPENTIKFDAQDVTISGKRVIDWFTNYLIENHSREVNIGWVVGVAIKFESNQTLLLGDGFEVLCKGVQFHAKRELAKKQKFVGINGTGFFDWQQSKATLPPQTNINTDKVQTNFMEWDDRLIENPDESGFLSVKLIGHSDQFGFLEDVIDLELL